MKYYKIYPGDVIYNNNTSSNYSDYKCEDGAYPIQNELCEGYEYYLTIDNDTIIAIEQITEVPNDYIPPVEYTPGLKTLKNLLATALAPCGTTLYVYGGGWDYQDVGSSNEAMSIGVSGNWVKFFNENNANYTYKNTNRSQSYYPFGEWNEYYYAGLDCSGYVGWVVYNVMNTESLSGKGYVMGSSRQAKTFAGYGWGTWQHTVEGSSASNYNYVLLANALKVGDILSTKGHVMIVLGKCSDGSFVILHSTPSNSITGQPGGGVQLSAINPKNSGNNDTEAYRLCDEYMKKYFPLWSERYEASTRSTTSAFDFPDTNMNTGFMHWTLDGTGVLTDPDGYANMSAREILEDLFNNK